MTEQEEFQPWLESMSVLCYFPKERRTKGGENGKNIQECSG